MPQESFPPLTVLVVDDHEDCAQSTAELLTLCGHAVQIAACGAAALHAVAVETPDVVVLDIGLPDMDGWAVAERIRRLAAGKQPLVIAVTGHGRESDRLHSADAGVDLHLVKPVDPVALTDLLSLIRRNLLSRRTALPSGDRL